MACNPGAATESLRSAGAGILLALAVLFPSSLGAQAVLDSDILSGLAARPIGPAVMSGRIAAIDAVAQQPLTMYIGAAGGGVWKSDDGGVTFKPVFDQHTQSIGAIAVDPSHPETVWVGTGEAWTRNSVSLGTGLYKTTDGGEHWTLVGLGDSEHIARIVVDPTNGDVVYVCALGHLFDANDERGVYKTADAGKTWKKVLFVDRDTGCSDLALDPQDTRILYAGMWQVRRRADFFTSGGPGSGLYKSMDGGDTWRELTTGLPSGEKGRIGVAVARSRPSVVYAVVEAQKTAMYRSDDLGETWRETNASNTVQARPFYFGTVVVDPIDFNRVYKPSFSLGISTDGGRSFSNPITGGANVHGDLHALWINPDNPYQLVLGTDGGVYISEDRGARWRHVKGLPVSQFYVVSVDMAVPYNVYGGLQDNGTWTSPSRGRSGGVTSQDWRSIGFGDGFHAYVDPTDGDIVYVEYQGGNILRVRQSTGEMKEVKPYPEGGGPDLRFNWNTPIHLSPTRAGTIYLGAQYLFRSRDRGDSWERISPDLTTNDPARQRQRESGGLTIDNSTAENNTTIYTISESPRHADEIWVGTDDGRLQLTRDGGGRWTDLMANVAGIPKGVWVSHVEAGRHADGVAYATFDAHYTGDPQPYVYRTEDFGATWTRLPTDSVSGYGHVIREDLVNPDLLFLGTEFGLYLSIDRGAHWTRLGGTFPPVAVRDLAIHPREHDLVIATHGRGVWILDDLTPLRHLTAAVLDSDVVMLPSRPAVMVIPASVQDFPGDDAFVGKNPDEAASIVYYLKRRPLFGDLKVEIYDSAGALRATYPAERRRGINRVTWPMRLRPPKVPSATSLVAQPASLLGPRLPEGTYRVKLIKGSDAFESSVTLLPDARAPYSAEDRAIQDRTVMQLYDMVQHLAYLVDAVADLRDQARQRAVGLGASDGLGKRLAAYGDRLSGFQSDLVSMSPAGRMGGEEKLREKLVALYGGVNGFEGRPTRSQLSQVQVLEAVLNAAQHRFTALVAERDGLTRQLAGRKLDALTLLTREEWEKR